MAIIGGIPHFQTYPSPSTTAGSPNVWPGRGWRRVASAPAAAASRRCRAETGAPCPARRCPEDPTAHPEPVRPGWEVSFFGHGGHV